MFIINNKIEQGFIYIYIYQQSTLISNQIYKYAKPNDCSYLGRR